MTALQHFSFSAGYHKHDCLFDEDEFRSEVYQRPFRYLHVLATRVQAQGQPKGQQPQGQQPQGHVQDSTSVQKADCLATILKCVLISLSLFHLCVVFLHN